MTKKFQKIAIIDYAGGNLASAMRAVEKAAALSGQDVQVNITDTPHDIEEADRLVLPGQGAFADCMQGLRRDDKLLHALKHAVLKGTPFLGICVGMQIMAQKGYEDKICDGLGWLQGDIKQIDAPHLRLPQMGWNNLVTDQDHPLVQGLGEDPHVYFVHSYALTNGKADECVAHTDYGDVVPALVARGNVAGTQFHTEKSQEVGLKILANFLAWQPQSLLAP